MKLKKAGGETAGLLATEANVSTHPSCLTKMTSQDYVPTDGEKVLVITGRKWKHNM